MASARAFDVGGDAVQRSSQHQQSMRGLDDAESVYFDRICQIRMDRWSVGRVVLLGDAAWCVSLFAGYGSSLAVGGADLLGDALDTTPDDIPAALASWERRLRTTVVHKQRQGRRARALFVVPNPLVLRLRLLALRLSASGLMLWLMRRFLGLTSRGRAMRRASSGEGPAPSPRPARTHPPRRDQRLPAFCMKAQISTRSG